MKLFKRHFLISIIFLSCISCKVREHYYTNLNKTAWIHGSENCNLNKDSLIQVVQLNYNTWILRQNKCTNYEAPFLFLLVGNKRALLMDTGATEDETRFPLYKIVSQLISQFEKSTKSSISLIVAHTHGHGDHTAGDPQFRGKPNTEVIGLNVSDVKSHFKIENWPAESRKIDLGNRMIEVIPIPGHQKASIAVYDYETKILLSGDSFYPGRLYIEDWQSFKSSIRRLTDFTKNHKVSYILGNHIEMTKSAGEDYPTGTTYQPDEHSLPLTVKDLKSLNVALTRLGDNPKREVHDNFIIYPK